MFTEEEKIRAIELYFKYGKKLPPVERELGYPSKRNLRRWIRSWEAGSGVSTTDEKWFFRNLGGRKWMKLSGKQGSKLF
ncbi:transposase (plasmid) [Escherichia albertii]|nr:transposase [Escherichia albertii]